ncbi:MAG TPA: DUF6776 family protein [Steroidobacteraceae bacterium]|nr:DUF6776 family protein [Steroidobacteraceae bacterium]
MTELPQTLVIRRVAPRRRALLVTLSILGAVLALGFAYECGRYDGGFDHIAALRERAHFGAALAALEQTNRTMRTQLAELETARVGRAQERAEFAKTIGELQNQVGRDSQELAFYRGVISQGINRGDPSQIPVRVQQLRITPDAGGAGRFHLRLMLLQVARPESAVTGTLAVSLAGDELGKAATLDLAALTGGKAHELDFNFRYFQSLDADIALPAGFRPDKLTVDVKSGRNPGVPLDQTFAWRVDAP